MPSHSYNFLQDMDENERFYLLAARRLSGEATEEELAELNRLLSVNAEWQWRFQNLKLHWESKRDVASDLDLAYRKLKLQPVQSPDSDRASDETELSEKTDRSGVRRRFSIRMAAAASLIAFLLGGYLIYEWIRPARTSQIVSKNELVYRQNPKGNTSLLYLSDSTRVILNADSKLEFPEYFDGETREVYLTGEAYFDVRHDKQKPFIIHAGRMNIKVLGTEFNVKSYPDDSTSEASLIRGMIEVTLTDRPSDKIILKPREKIVVSNDIDLHGMPGKEYSSTGSEAHLLVGKLHYLSPSDSTVLETVWIDNKVVFKNESFYKLAKNLERRYNVNIYFKNPLVKDFRFTGAFEKESINEILNALKLTERFDYSISKDSILIY